MFRFKRNLNDAIEVASLVSSDKLSHARIVAGKKRYLRLRFEQSILHNENTPIQIY